MTKQPDLWTREPDFVAPLPEPELARSTWRILDARVTFAHLGLLPFILDERDPRRAAEQLENPSHFADLADVGWHPNDGCTLDSDGTLRCLDDPPLSPIAECHLRDERLLFYKYEMLVIVQPDGSFEVDRVD